LSRCFTIWTLTKKTAASPSSLAFLAQIAECAELIERMERGTLDVLGRRILLSEAFGAHDAWNWGRPGNGQSGRRAAPEMV
jgi:hypothetical protein